MSITEQKKVIVEVLLNIKSKHGLTQIQLASMININQSSLSKLLNYKIKSYSLDFLWSALENIGIELELKLIKNIPMTSIKTNSNIFNKKIKNAKKLHPNRILKSL